MVFPFGSTASPAHSGVLFPDITKHESTKIPMIVALPPQFMKPNSPVKRIATAFFNRRSQVKRIGAVAM
jgi:hypothetical protein